MAASLWKAFPCCRRQLRLDVVLQCGQSFRWRENSNGEWMGVISGRVWRLKQDDTHIYFQVYSNDELSATTKAESKPVQQENSDHHWTSTQINKTSQAKPQTVDRAKNSGTKSQLDAADKLFSQVKNEKSECDIDSKSGILNKTLHEGIKVPNIKREPEESEADDQFVSILRDYFQLDVDVDSLYQQWSHADPYFRKIASDFWGIRMLRQDPVENLFSFICSSNNNIARISSMVEKLCVHYGQLITEVDGTLYHSFPVIASLAGSEVEEKLRELGFGYRARFIATSARFIMENHGEGWVSSLRQSSYEEAKTELLKLCGVGAKVADCVCLMSLDKTGAIPVDTHVWQFAARNYLPKLQSAKSVTEKLYQEIGDHFRNLWGPYAGWAHSVLFTAELRHMQSMKSAPDQMQRTVGTLKKKKRDDKDLVKSAKRLKTPKKK